MMTTTLVTGANRGIGLELCRFLRLRGDSVIAACRTSSAALEDLGVQIESGVEVTSEPAVQQLADRLRGVALDLLILNAGVLRSDRLDELDWEAMREQFEVNSLGPLRIVSALRANLVPGSRIGILTSRMGSIADNRSGGSYGYRMSKAAVNAAGVSLAHDLKPAGVAVLLLHPGFVRTEMTGGQGYVDPGEAARQLLQRLDELSLEESGTFRHANGDPLPW